MASEGPKIPDITDHGGPQPPFASGVIHRDIKGANLLTKKVADTVLVKLADFGVACTTLENPGTEAAGSPYWMAPEVIQLHPASCASDIWSLACTLIELLTGDPPNYDLMPLQALYQIVQNPEPSIPDHITPKCREFLLRCFKKDPVCVSACWPKCSGLQEGVGFMCCTQAPVGGPQGEGPGAGSLALTRPDETRAPDRLPGPYPPPPPALRCGSLMWVPRPATDRETETVDQRSGSVGHRASPEVY